jgi:CRISPR/Cas system-associated protein Cas10 (large subunit of type III CRISPR-Cas system)
MGTLEKTQVCTVCGEEKPLSDFPKNGRDKDGNVRHRPDCKVCYNITRKISKKKHTKFLNNTKHRTGEEQTLSIEDWKECMIHFRGTCAYCGEKQSRKVKLTKEHVVPVSKGGMTVKDNIIPGCTSCNCSKSNQDLEVWYPKQPFYSKERYDKIRRWCNGQD